MNATIPSEFAAFVRETGVRAFDRAAGRLKGFDKSLQPVLKTWSKLTDTKKHELFDILIAAARDDDPIPEETPKRSRAVKRYDPEEVAKTLPVKNKPKPKK
ncbi:MAG: hypothetical protein ACXVIJ_14825 [Thermoanaerobaculia bacterium]